MGGDPGRDQQPRLRTWLDRGQAATLGRIDYWRQSRLLRRLQAADVINQGLQLAAVLLLCFLPFLLVLEAVSGRTDASGFIRRFGLTGEAAHAVRQALTAPAAPSAAFTGLSWVFFVLFGIATAGAIQDLYGSVFDVKGRRFRDLPRLVVWLAAALGVSFAGAWTQPWLDRVGGPGLVAIAALPAATAFWWFSMWLLLDGRLRWRELFPSALATGICWLGMVIVFRLTLSSTIVSSYRKYGSIGVVFAIMPLLIAIGVVIMLGAILGVAWRDRHEHPPGEQPESSAEPDRLQRGPEFYQEPFVYTPRWYGSYPSRTSLSPSCRSAHESSRSTPIRMLLLAERCSSGAQPCARPSSLALHARLHSVDYGPAHGSVAPPHDHRRQRNGSTCPRVAAFSKITMAAAMAYMLIAMV